MRKKEKRGMKRERKLNQSFQEHVVIGLWQTLGRPQTSDRNGISISRLASAPLSLNPAYAPGAYHSIVLRPENASEFI